VDDTRLAWLLASTALVVGAGTIILASAASYPPPGEGAVPPGGAVFPLGTFGGLLLAHVALYAASARLPSRALVTIPYLSVQLAIAISLTRVSGGAFSCAFFFVVFATQTVAFQPQHWPLIVVVTSWIGLISMRGYSTEINQIIGITGLLAMSVMAIYLVGFVREAVAKRQAGELLAELREASAELNGYAEEVEQAALAGERQRLARELHDTLAQGLVGVALQLEAADTYLGAEGAGQAKAIVRQALARARETLAEARRAIEGLRAAETRASIEETLRREASRFAVATGIECEMDIDLPAELAPAINEQVRRVVTEALTNVARHARAGRVDACVRARDGSLEVTVRDDGIGFEAAEAAAGTGHFGLLGLDERARSMGGSFTVDSAPGQGTTLYFEVPMP
jgi:signal transduction histidine kinase